MITFKKTFDFYATDVELDVFVNNVFDTIIGDPEADVEVYADSDTDHRYVTVNILDPDDYYDLEFQQDDGWQFIKIEVWDRVLH